MKKSALTFFGCLLAACSSKYNVVRLTSDGKSGSSQLALTTQHYLSLDGDRMLELDRGERTLSVEFRRAAGTSRPGDEPVTVVLKLYDTDPAPKGALRVDMDGRSFEFEPRDLKKDPLEETVTVLDTGQRQQENPNLANSAQAQTGYITFGKPAAAGAAKRTWMVYRFQILPESALLHGASTAKRISLSVTIGRLTGEAQASEKEIRAWKKYANGEYDEKADP